MTQPAPTRYDASALAAFVHKLFIAAGCEQAMALVMAEVLLEADLMGHTTHGLALAGGYLEEIESGDMLVKGEPTVISDRGAAICWDGMRLPGVWLTARAVDLCVERARIHGTAALAIRRSHHAGCLAAYLERATSKAMMVCITSSDPGAASVAPFGGLKAVFTPDPLAVGIPTAGDPILVDMSASITTNGMTGRLRAEGRKYPGLWAMTAAGVATDDPNELYVDPPGTLLPSGGKDHGHKGYGMALAVEALTQGLSGYGRADHPTGWGAAVMVQVYDPAAFGGTQDFLRQTEWIAQACRDNPPATAGEPVRLPGGKAAQNKREALRHGVALHHSIMPGLAAWATKLGVTAPLRSA